MLCNAIICAELSFNLVEGEHVEPASLIPRWVKTHLSTILHWICIDQESPPWPAFKGPTRMAFFSSKAGRRLLTVKYLGTIYPCDTRKMLGIIRWCCKNTQCIEIWLSAHLFDFMWRRQKCKSDHPHHPFCQYSHYQSLESPSSQFLSMRDCSLHSFQHHVRSVVVLD